MYRMVRLSSLNGLVEEAGTEKVLKNIALSTNVSEAVSKADLVIEAFVENVEVKQKLLDRVENAVKSGTILATNTSSLKLTDIAANLKHKELFGGLHFFNPVPKQNRDAFKRFGNIVNIRHFKPQGYAFWMKD
uniref:3-hydroxyacyl-CoA dehydrogenase NAD binding domain-containing protein n=1 Tax=Meloidogyne javanica TaxID=6303 RepID=A0A915MHB2_MELJA